jgi:hypothetical protein
MFKKIIVSIFSIFIAASLQASDKQVQEKKAREDEMVRRLDLFNKQQQAAQASQSIVLKQRPQLTEDEIRRNQEISRDIEVRVIPSGRFAGMTVAKAAQIMADERNVRKGIAFKPINDFSDEPSVG